MIIDRDTFLDLKLMLKGMKDVTKLMAKHIATDPESKQGISPFVGELMGHVASMGEILNVVDEENKAHAPTNPTAGRA